jgi:hypothetical protein
MYLRQSIQSVLGLFFLVSGSLALSNTAFTYNVIDGGIKLTGCVDGCPSDLVIPEEIDGLDVVSLGAYAFQNQGIETVIFPEGLKRIERGSFYQNQLTNILLPNSLEYLSGFDGNQISSVTIPANVSEIGIEAFIYNDLQSITIPESVQIISSEAFSSNAITDIYFTSGLNTIGFCAFCDNNLSNLTLPNSLTDIGNYAFKNNQLLSLSLPDSVTNIPAHSFSYNQITSVSIPSSIMSISVGAFRNNQLNSLKFLGEPPVFENTALSENMITTIYYCQNEHGQWDGVIIEGITPQLDEDCGDTNDLDDEEHEEEHHGDGEYCYGDEHGDEDGHEEEHDHDVHCYSALDLDQNGSFEALTDALILLRYAFGLRGDNLINGAIATDANRTAAEDIEEHIQSLLP